MENREAIKAVAERLALPETRTSQPCLFVAGGAERNAAQFFDCLREFFPAVFVSSAIAAELDAEVMIGLANNLTGRFMCPFVAAGAVHPSKFSCLAHVSVPLFLLWIADCKDGVPSKIEADRVEWLKSQLGAERYYLIDSSQDLYPQIFSLPFLPGTRR